MNAAMSVTPMQRPDYWAKPHSKPVRWHKQAVRIACEQAVARALEVGK